MSSETMGYLGVGILLISVFAMFSYFLYDQYLENKERHKKS